MQLPTMNPAVEMCQENGLRTVARVPELFHPNLMTILTDCILARSGEDFP
jgi:hypothetical protein